ncbi:GNAT family N-acetyltransferase [Deinococcus sp. KNUC1210]|uniref:GNAT family N-acetyltransferase n=1 Tax=Deinococcus sp. KNUC1210 TaxID=2917691 RepID=UPI001EF0ADEE|nr:GNAT family N-acetyltransferase [Deinococcus sp. KNUC1210]ULH14408.1 GNAT family N-acetyltransferase [Deinococcus sp. KNUC1210]
MLRPYDPSRDAADFLRLQNLASGHGVSLDSFLKTEASWPAHLVRRQAVTERDGAVVGMAALRSFDYVPPNWLLLTLAVDPAARGQGLGNELERWATAQATELRLDGLAVNVLETAPAGRAWAERRGFALHAHRFASELNLNRPYPAAELPPTLRLRDMTNASEADWDSLEALYGELLTQTPDLAGQPRWTPEALRLVLRDSPRLRPEWLLLAVDEHGETVGLCHGVPISTGIYNEFTAVLPGARGRGLARALKLELIRRAQAAGVQRMRTNNHASNAPMLRVNAALGFEALAGSWELRRTLV